MAMTIRFTDEETAAVRRQADLEGTSMQDVVRTATREHIEGYARRELLEHVLEEDLPRYRDALERLGR